MGTKHTKILDLAPFIDGASVTWPRPWLDSTDPSTALVWSRVARCGAREADLAIRSAGRAFRAGLWSKTDACDRADSLDTLAEMLEARWEKLVDAENRDNGKCITEVRGQFAGLHIWYRYFAAQVRTLAPEPQRSRFLAFTVNATGYHMAL